MPPKNNKKQIEKQKKNEDKKRKERIIEDKTFGLKNKNKSAQVQKYIKGVQKQVQGDKNSQIPMMGQSRSEKQKSQADQALLASLFKSLATIPVADKEQEKTVICSAYKQGHCEKGDKCQFSHDLSNEVIQEKPDLYTDNRECVRTETTCKFFLEAVETHKHGWFWKCPNGDTCIYRHALPADYVIKTDEEKRIELLMLMDDDREPIEVTLDEERRNLPPGGTPVTFELFMKWVHDDETARQKAVAGKTGIVLLNENPDAFQDDEGAFEEYLRDEEPLEEDKEELEEDIGPQKKLIQEDDIPQTYTESSGDVNIHQGSLENQEEHKIEQQGDEDLRIEEALPEEEKEAEVS